MTMEPYLHKEINLNLDAVRVEIVNEKDPILDSTLCTNHTRVVLSQEHRAAQQQVSSTAHRPRFTLNHGQSQVRIPTSAARPSTAPVENRSNMARALRTSMAGSPPQHDRPEEPTMTDPTCPICREPAADTTERTKRGITYADYICPNQHLWHSHWLLPAIPVDPPDMEAS